MIWCIESNINCDKTNQLGNGYFFATYDLSSSGKSSSAFLIPTTRLGMYDYSIGQLVLAATSVTYTTPLIDQYGNRYL